MSDPLDYTPPKGLDLDDAGGGTFANINRPDRRADAREAIADRQAPLDSIHSPRRTA